ncbi:hypothetical protein Fmac_017691 [Flemingia macrophylla]|uniref:Uncharacterized protein n=1 Tax=Flemingia macrophylla TaxID=520843 RepID=A0ABD1M4N9_9FABA
MAWGFSRLCQRDLCFGHVIVGLISLAGNRDYQFRWPPSVTTSFHLFTPPHEKESTSAYNFAGLAAKHYSALIHQLVFKRPYFGKVVITHAWLGRAKCGWSYVVEPPHTGFRGLCRNLHGRFLFDFYGSLGFLSILSTEVHGLFHGLCLCWDKGF